MILQGSTSATWALMVGDVMLMKGLSCVEDQLNLLLPRSFWCDFTCFCVPLKFF